jgi:NAD(P)-dependent dehydrogenase (short-subunit alcohol dehydrogenase family)
MYRKQGIRTNAIAPGPTVTSIQVDASPEAHGPAVVGQFVGANIGRMGTADEQADAIVYLASDAAAFVNGVILPVDDGWAAV